MELSDFRLPVINLNSNALEIIHLDQVEQITKLKGNTIFHLKGIEYKLLTSLDDYNEYLFHLGLRQTDSINVVNINRVESYSDELKLLYFDSAKKHFASVAAIQSRYIKHLVSGLKKGLGISVIDQTYLEQEDTKNKKSKKFLDFFNRKTHNS